MGLESYVSEIWIQVLKAILKGEILDSPWLLIKIILLFMLVFLYPGSEFWYIVLKLMNCFFTSRHNDQRF